MNVNINPETGIRYGVTYRIPDWIFDESLNWDCPDEEDALAEYARERAAELIRSGKIVYFDFPEGIEPDEDADIDEMLAALDELNVAYVQDMVEKVDGGFHAFWDVADFSESTRCGWAEGMHLMLTSLGGAPMLWVLDSPYRAMVRLCSPCVPNAGDLDSPDPDGWECYGLPPDFYDGEE